MGWRFASRADLEAVVRIEFKPSVAEEVLRHHEGLEVDYAVNVWSRSCSDAAGVPGADRSGARAARHASSSPHVSVG